MRIKFAAMAAILAIALVGDIASQSDSPSAAYESYSPDLFSGLSYRAVGPSRGGRVTAVAGHRAEPSTFYMGATGGGVWKTGDYGTSWRNISDGYFATGSIGAIRVAESDPSIVYVGTGSDGLRSNVIIGKGVYKSTDAGETWTHVGLEEVGNIGAVLIHPQDPDRVYVAAIGNPFAPTIVAPGTYRARLAAGEWSDTRFFEVRMDPRQEAVGVTLADVTAQIELVLEVRSGNGGWMAPDPLPMQTSSLGVLYRYRHTSLAVAALLSIATPPATAQANHPRDPELQPQLRRALDYLRDTEPLTLEEQIRICEIPAPPFQEQARGEYVKKRFIELGLRNVHVDQEGNVIAERPGAVEGTLVVVSAHLDTVFPEGTEVRVARQGSVLQAPGIGDDSRGLAVMLAVARALEETGIETEGSIVFVATVGEEGLGNLRGVRHLFRSELGERITHFIAIDGTGLDIVSRAVGSHRYRVTFHGAGGHSWKAFGLPSPLHAMGRAIDKISRFRVPENPKTAYNVGRVGGGTSVNSIAHSAWMEIDMRSENAGELDRLDSRFRQAVMQAVQEENAFRESEDELTVEIESVGRRPTGNQDDASAIIQAAARASAMLGIEAELVASSTDSNIPISLGIPAVTLRGGGEGTGAHSLAEQFDVTDSHLGTQRVLLTTLEIAGVREAVAKQ